MSQSIGSLTGSNGEIIILVAVAVVAVAFRIFLMKNQGTLRAKCPKCNAVFDASHSFPILRLGPKRPLKCPACGKTSLMNAHVKDPITWPAEETKPQQTSQQLAGEDLEKQRIEDSKYEKA